MMLFETYAKRKRAQAKSGVTDVYQYQVMPPFLRKQIARIFTSGIGHYVTGRESLYTNSPNECWETISDVILQEIENYESFCNHNFGTAQHHLLEYIIYEDDIDNILSVIEILCRQLEIFVKNNVRPGDHRAEQPADAALSEINARFREHAVGYQYENGNIIRIDSQLIHAEVIKPALALLAQPGFEKANADFMEAHRHHRTGGEEKAAVTAAGRAFESTLKAICSQLKWTVGSGAGASELVKICRANGLFPDYLDKGFETYIAMLKTGLPDVRNNAGAHGAAPNDAAVPDYLAGYAINMTAANIVMSVEAFNRMH